MISTYKDVISLFGEKDEEAEVLALNFSIKCPDFTWHDLLKCIELIIENFHMAKSDNSMYDAYLHSRQIGANGWTAMISQMLVKNLQNHYRSPSKKSYHCRHTDLSLFLQLLWVLNLHLC